VGDSQCQCRSPDREEGKEKKFPKRKSQNDTSDGVQNEAQNGRWKTFGAIKETIRPVRELQGGRPISFYTQNAVTKKNRGPPQRAFPRKRGGEPK